MSLPNKRAARRPQPTTSEIDRLLTLLVESTQGATSRALHDLQGVQLETMEEAIRRGYVGAEVEHVKSLDGPSVVRLRITTSGRALLRLSAAVV